MGKILMLFTLIFVGPLMKSHIEGFLFKLEKYGIMGDLLLWIKKLSSG